MPPQSPDSKSFSELDNGLPLSVPVALALLLNPSVHVPTLILQIRALSACRLHEPVFSPNCSVSLEPSLNHSVH